MTHIHSSIHTTDYEFQSFDVIKVSEGEANLRIHALYEIADPAVSAGLMRMDPCTFEATTEGRETLCIFEGAVTVKLDGKDPLELTAGDLLVLEAGVFSKWTVTDAVKLLYVTGS